ncbi:hypothetical protein MtrunA17_Chr4g0064261 [Medicago truncatula]|uniref:Uncharacterized protein n=1 Tax=Medicago truncatula TaxID=3880 RepID=A0A396IEG9_MEDTR|nr:hypothetical protein MtrunA17_Chr4g0064261 [Medicago truncatula]
MMSFLAFYIDHKMVCQINAKPFGSFPRLTNGSTPRAHTRMIHCLHTCMLLF